MLVSEVYRIANTAAEEIESLPTPSADSIRDGMEIDEKGNLSLKLQDGHTLTLVRHHKSKRKMTKEEEVTMIKVSFS